jgi:hypothetical protein
VEEENRIWGVELVSVQAADQLFHQPDIGFVNNLWIVVAVHGCQVNDCIALADEFFELFSSLEECIFERDTLELFGV